ncbi:MAG: SurA N-terminal domain-containing protein [Desulfobacterales bacterium]|uniref:SurA N-terminal domain-containing protein n=1 Tax=Candidatus Desulfaltia bathyphila TaxID=2841697 RepID=A0A8J6T7S3_9BACT|nr:SurA N-terminal domain-containing protein [Candidatus Desulfaltia bathyphila]MBL7195584.1 SurA N-terminal domain-containing protein [Desulfobacterales bacterium]MBL7208014.1 SurA N-terminal domain-containing protein [Desulfobacterales bacterium]
MIRYSNKLSPMFGALLIIYILTGCGDYGSDLHSAPSDNYLIRVGDRVATTDDFNRAFEIIRTAYSHNALQEPDSCRGAKLRLLSQLIEEMIILERAKELNVEISDSEVDEAVARMKGDYDDNAFEQILLEYAVSYNLWEKELGKRLLIEKVVERELKEHVVITPEDISNYYEKHYNGHGGPSALSVGTDNADGDLNRIIVKQLRRKKAEEAYKPWIENLRKKYLIEINKKEWEHVIA